MNEVSHALLRDIEVKDRRFRFVQTLFFFLVAGMLAVLLLASYRSSSDNQQVIANQGKTLSNLNANAKHQTNQINDLQQHIDCIVALLQQPNRSTLRISDLENCSLEQLQASSVLGGNANGATKSGSVDDSSDTSSKSTSAPVLSTPAPIQGSETTPQNQNTPDLLNTEICLPFLKSCTKAVL